MSELNRLVVEKGKIIDKKIFKKYFVFQGLIDMKKEFNRDKNKSLHITTIN